MCARGRRGEERRWGGARICQGRHTRAQIYKAAAVLRPRKVPPAAPPPPSLPRAYTNDRSSRTGRGTRLDSTRLDTSSFSKNDSLSLSLRNSPRSFANIKVVEAEAEGEAAHAPQQVAPAWRLILRAVPARERGDRRESFLNEEEMEDKREVIPLVIEGRREGRMLGYAQVSRPCFTAP